MVPYYCIGCGGVNCTMGCTPLPTNTTYAPIVEGEVILTRSVEDKRNSKEKPKPYYNKFRPNKGRW